MRPAYPRKGDGLTDPHILVVAGDESERRGLADALESAGHGVSACAELDDGVPASPTAVRLVVLGRAESDLRAFADLRRRRVDAPCLVAVDGASVDDAVGLVRQGAFDVIGLPIDPVKLRFQAEKALRHKELCDKNAALEKSLAASERLAMIGKLAAGVAHELNNPLDGVLRFVNLSIEGLPKDAPQIPYLVDARRGLRRMADIVHDLLQFSRNANVEASTEDAERLARDAAAQAAAGATNRAIETKFEFPPVGVPLPRAMFQVFANLAKNAVDAMPRGGTLTIAARLADGRVRIDVTDTGTGIPEEIRERVFEPFFTTKEVGRGTGLGLPICQRIVERLGGVLTIESEVGCGTTVSIDLPSRRPAAAHAAPVAVRS